MLFTQNSQTSSTEPFTDVKINNNNNNNTSHLKYVQYEYIERERAQEKEKNNTNNNPSIFDLSTYLDRQVVSILRPLHKPNTFFLPNDIFIDIDIVLNREGDHVKKDLISEFKKINRIEWIHQQKMVNIKLETSIQQIYDFSQLIYQFSTLQNAKLASCIEPLKRFEKICLAQWDVIDSMSKNNINSLHQRQEYINAKKQQILESLDFKNKYIYILNKGLDIENTQSTLLSIQQSEKMMELLGVFHALNMFGLDRSEMSNLIYRKGILSIFSRTQATESTMNFFLVHNQMQEKMTQSSEQEFRFTTIDNIAISCKGIRTQYNVTLDYDQQFQQSTKIKLSSCLLIAYDLQIPPLLLQKIANQRFEQLKYFSKLTNKLSRKEAQQFCMDGQYPEECHQFLKKYYKDVMNKEVKNINSNFYDLSWLNNI